MMCALHYCDVFWTCWRKRGAVTQETVARGIVAPPAGGIEGVDVSPAAFVDRSAFIDAARTGLSGEVVKQAIDVFGHRELIVRLVGTTSGNLHRVYRRKTLGPAQSEMLLDTLRVFFLATSAFGSLDRANEWLDTAVPALGGQRPVDLCDTFEGRRLVQDAIGRIEHGEFP